MTTFKTLLTSAFLACAAVAMNPTAKGDIITIKPLFEYPVAPEELTTITDKSNYLVEHFWDTFDFKSKLAVDQNALNDAFRVFCVPMNWADREMSLKGVDNLIAQISKNPTLQIQFMKAAEEQIYGPRANMWVDEIYTRFIDSFLKNKKIPEVRKKRYERQLKQIRNTTVGQRAAEFDFTTPTGNPGKFQPIGVLTVIEFGDPDCDDCRMAKLKMDTDVTFSTMVDKGQINVMFIVPDPTEGWQTKLTGYPNKWVVGASDTVSDIYDLRVTPSFYLIGKDGNVIGKNLDVKTAMDEAIRAAKEPVNLPTK